MTKKGAERATEDPKQVFISRSELCSSGERLLIPSAIQASSNSWWKRVKFM